MVTITIPQKEYKVLKQQSAAYKKMASRLFDSVVKDDASNVVVDFRKTGLYADEFLKDLEGGLAKSSRHRKA